MTNQPFPQDLQKASTEFFLTSKGLRSLDEDSPTSQSDDDDIEVMSWLNFGSFVHNISNSRIRSSLRRLESSGKIRK